MDSLKAISFVKEKGTGLEIARLRHILYSSEPESEVIRPFLELQSSKGGFPLSMQAGNPDMVDNTLTALWWLDEMGMLRAPAGQKALGFLQSVQMADGGWDEDVSIESHKLPPWVQPGDLNTRLYLSAYAAYWLAASGYGTAQFLEKAMAFVLQHQKESGMFYGYLHTTWIATSACFLAGCTEPANRGLQALLDRPLSDWEDSQCAWALDSLYRGGIERDHPLIEKLLAKLESSQRSEGEWASEDGDPYAASATIGALKAFKLYNRLLVIPPGLI